MIQPSSKPAGKETWEEVQILYDADNNEVHTRDVKGYTPLILAVYNQNRDVVQFLLENGADPNAMNAAANTAIMGCFQGLYRAGGNADTGRG